MNHYRLTLVISFLLFVTGTAQGQQHPNQARGFSANNEYSTFDIDNINLFNGNLVVNIPLGGKYPVGGNLSYSLTLFYNSNLWTQTELGGLGAVDYDYSMFTTLRLETVGGTTHFPNGGSVKWRASSPVVERFLPAGADTSGEANRGMDGRT